MKYHVFITKREILTTIILIIGLAFLFKGVHSYYTFNYKISHALSLNTLDEHELKNGTYVKGDIDTYIGQTLYGNGRFSGVILSVVAAILFFGAGGIKNLVIEEAGHTEPFHNNNAKIYNRDAELLAKKKQLETLERRLKSIKRNAILCLVFLLSGIYIAYSAYLLGIKVFGILLILISVRGIWKYFINSSNAAAVSIVKRFTLKSLSLQIEEHKNNIKRLEGQHEI